MTVNVYLDTCVLSDESFVDWLSNEAQGVRASISSVVYMERRRQLLSRRRDPEKPGRLTSPWYRSTSTWGRRHRSI